MTTATRKMLHMAGAMSSTRELTDEGYLRVDATISQEGVFPFRSNELDGPDGATDIEWVYIPPDTLFDKKTIADVSILPTTNGHPGPDVGPENYHELATGHVISNTVGRVGPGNHLGCKLLITRADAIQSIQTHEAEEISLGFYADVEPAEGDFEGKHYTKRFKAPLNVNHVAVVPKGRAGHQVRIHNAMPDDLLSFSRAQVKALMAVKLKRLNMQELTAEDLENVIWSDPERELAASELAAREAERKTMRDMGQRPATGPEARHWDGAMNANREMYEQEVRGRVKNAARRAKAGNLLSIALATGLTAVLADHVWSNATEYLGQDKTGTGASFQGRQDMAPVPGRILAITRLDAMRRFSQHVVRVIGDPALRETTERRAMARTERALSMNDAVMDQARFDRLSRSDDFARDLGEGFVHPDGRARGDAVINELDSQYAKLKKDLYDKFLTEETKAVDQYVRAEVGVMVATFGVLAGGGAVLGSKLGEIRDKAIAFVESGGAESEDRTDMETVPGTKTSAEMVEDLKQRVKAKLKPMIPGNQKGYPRGFVHGTIGGALAGGLLGFGAAQGFGAVSGAVGGLTGSDEVAMPPAQGYYYPEK